MKSSVLIVLASISGVWSGPLGVTFSGDQCVLKGASALIRCQYDYPFGHIVTAVGWFKLNPTASFQEASQLPIFQDPPGRFQYLGNYRGNCRLWISDVGPADAGDYIFSFRTTLGGFTSDRVQLSVKELTAVVRPSSVAEGDAVSLTCETSCNVPLGIRWFRDGQPVEKAAFRARRWDSGRYHCAAWGEERTGSASVALNVQYPPDRPTLSIRPGGGGGVVRGTSVSLSCSSDANPRVTDSGYSLYRDGRLVGSGQNHVIPDVQPDHGGRYHCRARNGVSSSGVDHFNSSAVPLRVYYAPVNVSIETSPARVTWGSRVNLTCSGAADPPADAYSWYRKTRSSGPGGLWVGSGQVLAISSMEVSLSGLYFCQAQNRLGEENSTEVLLAMEEEKEEEEEEKGSQTLPAVAGIGLALILALAFALVLFWRKKRSLTREKEAEWDSGANLPDNESSGIYANIHRPRPPLPNPAVQTREEPSVSQGSEVTYSSVIIKSRGLADVRTDVHGSRPGGEDSEDRVIYASVKTG